MEMEITIGELNDTKSFEPKETPIMNREGRCFKRSSKLNPNGNIPKGEHCPFHNECGHVDTTCRIGHDVTKNEMSCALARAFDMIS